MNPMNGTDLMVSRRCTARARNGNRCQRAPIQGGTVCHMHGGAAPQVRQTAQARIAALVDPALDALQRALRSRDLTAALRAARDVLDRAGLQATTSVEVSGPHGGPVQVIERVIVSSLDYMRWMPDDQVRQLRAWKGDALERKAAGFPPFTDAGTLDVD